MILKGVLLLGVVLNGVNFEGVFVENISQEIGLRRLSLGMIKFWQHPTLQTQTLNQVDLQHLSVGSSQSLQKSLLQINAIEKLAKLTTVRIFTPNASGSGVIIKQQESTYTIITNWHVLASSSQVSLMTPDGQKYPLFGIRQLGNMDLAIAHFKSNTNYQIAAISPDAIALGEPVFAAGFPMYQEQSFQTTFEQGLQVFRLTQGVVSLLPSKSLPDGYRLGYTNDIKVGMSGGPIFNQQGQLIGVNGRTKYRDPNFGVYGFEDGTQPSKEMLELMVNSSWGIPINPNLAFQGN